MKKLLVSTPCKSEVSNTCKSNVIRNMTYNCECGEGYKCVYISIYRRTHYHNHCLIYTILL